MSLTIDFAKSFTWRYLFCVDISGTIATPDSSHQFSTSLRTYLVGERAPFDSGAVRFRTSQPLITSNFLDEQARLHLERQFENTALYFSPKEGAVDVPDTVLPPLLSIGGWDLFRSFARVLPVLPESPQRIGSTWDRERTVPIETTIGNATGWLYQSFRLDSIISVDSSRGAWLSWRFSYRIDPPAADSLPVVKALPLHGEGTGNALIDLTAKRLIKANAFFEVPAAQDSRIKMSMQESVHLELVE